ncbi:MAG: hypothetical protein OD811_01045 [Alphaproteobacteria bacterium]
MSSYFPVRRFRAGTSSLFPALGARSAWPVLLVFAFVVSVALLSGTFAYGLGDAARQWQRGLLGQYTLELPSVTTLGEPLVFGQGDASSAGEYEREVVGFLLDSPEVASLERVEEAEVRALLEPWLESVPSDFLLPKLYDLTLANPQGQLTDRLTEELAFLAPAARLERYDTWNDPMLRTALILRWLSLGVLLFACSAFIFVVVSASRAVLDGHAEMVRLLHCLGATDNFLARSVAGGALRLGVIGAALGALFALPLLLLARSLEGPLATLVVPHVLWLLFLAPLLGGFLAFLVSTLSVRLLLWRTP